MEYSLIRLNDEMRSLIEAVAPPDTHRVLLDPMDKGLSGATVWLAKWSMTGGLETPYTVIKIGEEKKIRREIEAYQNIVSELDHDVGAFRWKYPETDGTLAILRQPFRSDSESMVVISLLDMVRRGLELQQATNLIDEIYLERLKNWHPVSRSDRTVEELSFNEALDWWMSRFNLVTNIEQMSRPGISSELHSRFGFGVKQLEEKVLKLSEQRMPFVIGPVHGDLHAQNIILEPSNDKIHLIDFGWTAKKWKAIDFLMLECSLKFLAAPSNARVTNLLDMESKLEEDVSWQAPDFLKTCVYSRQIAIIGAMISRIRSLCIDQFGFVSNFEEYRKGLIVLTGALAGYPPLNRRYLVNSLALHCSRLSLA